MFTDSLVTAAVLTLLLVAVGCFVVGSLSPAAWIARALGKDVRSSGSGNPGATNAGRVLGVRWGVLVGVLDVLKGFLPTWLVLRSMGSALASVAAVALVLGHVFSPFLKGRGGKGVATALGVLLALTPWIALATVVVFGVWVLVLHRIGEASAAASVALFTIGALTAAGVLPWAEPRSLGAVVMLLAIVVLARHRRNIIDALGRRRERPPTS